MCLPLVFHNLVAGVCTPILYHIVTISSSLDGQLTGRRRELRLLMAKVKAAYNYSYNYEGMKISFKKDEEFQLLTKSNKDWWQVRRWLEGNAQDIYVPAVYMKEVEGTTVAVMEEKDPTYMNLDDLKIPKSYENGTKSSGEKLSDTPAVLNKPKTMNSFKRDSLERNKPLLEKKSSTDKDSVELATSNGLNTTTPSVLQRLSNRVGPGTVPGNQEGQVGGSLKRGESLVPPPVSTKPRSKSSAVETAESSLDTGSRLVRQTSGGAVQSSKGKVPPPVQSKPRAQKVPISRPVSCMAPGTDMEGIGRGVEGMEGSRPIVSELSSVLLKKNPHLASEHKPLMKTSSSGAVVETSMGGIKGDGLSKSLDGRSPPDKVRRCMSQDLGWMWVGKEMYIRK